MCPLDSLLELFEDGEQGHYDCSNAMLENLFSGCVCCDDFERDKSRATGRECTLQGD